MIKLVLTEDQANYLNGLSIQSEKREFITNCIIENLEADLNKEEAKKVSLETPYHHLESNMFLFPVKTTDDIFESLGKAIAEGFDERESVKVEELDYEILSFRPTENNPAATITYIRSIKDVSSLKWHLESDFWEINSVKRKSDGEVFTIGDKAPFLGDYADLIGFKTDNNKCSAIFTQGSYTFPELLSNMVFKNKPLFTTEDGVEIKVNDAFYYIGDGDNVCKSKCLFKGDGDFGKPKTFSSKEKAEEYILFNKPMLSLNDILSRWNEKSPEIDIDNGNIYFYKQSDFFKRILNKAKSKL